jgi:hypothetical protein
MELEFQPVWFDSIGAKSSCILIITDHNILIDPGAAVMHPSFPAKREEKIKWYERAKQKIRLAARDADVIVISHYHHDHYIAFDADIYSGKLIFVKNPNQYINDSQQSRAEKFFNELCRNYGVELEDMLEPPEEKEFLDPMDGLKIAGNKSFGDYQKRRHELLEKGRRWFYGRVRKWCECKRIPEISFENIEVRFADDREFKLGKTKIRFTEPFFHGIEFSKVGWVFSTVVEFRGTKIIHSSDLNGPIIEDYAEWIIHENPNILILDGPMTYMLGYTLNLTNFRRAVENATKIILETDTQVIIYDHHLPRESKFRERTREVWEVARKLDKKVLTAAEFLGMQPVVLA